MSESRTLLGRIEKSARELVWPIVRRLRKPVPAQLCPVVPGPRVLTEGLDPRTASDDRLQPYFVSHFRFHAVATLPYARQGLDYRDHDVLLDLTDPRIPVDEEGVVVFIDDSGTRAYHPVAIAQYGLAALGGWEQTRLPEYLVSAQANARKLIEISEMDGGARWFPYRHDHVYLGETVRAPWYSAMAQGQAMSLFLRLGEALDDPQWRTPADETFQSLLVERREGMPWSAFIDEEGFLWFEEYAGDVEPLRVLNGHVYALFGLYDYFRFTGLERAWRLFDGGATTVLRYIPILRVDGGVSYYCARPDYCRRPEWQNAFYHPIHVDLLTWLGEMTGERAFFDAAHALESDYQRTE